MSTSKPTLAKSVLAGRVANGRGWTQSELAEIAEVSLRTIANIESGRTKSCTPRVLAKLGFAMGRNLMKYSRCTPRGAK